MATTDLIDVGLVYYSETPPAPTSNLPSVSSEKTEQVKKAESSLPSVSSEKTTRIPSAESNLPSISEQQLTKVPLRKEMFSTSTPEIVSTKEENISKPEEEITLKTRPPQPVDIYLSDIEKVLMLLNKIDSCTTLGYISKATGVPADIVARIISGLSWVTVRSGHVICTTKAVKKMVKQLQRVTK